MPVSRGHAELLADKYVIEHKLKPGAKFDIVNSLITEFCDDNRINDLLVRKFLDGDDNDGKRRDHLKIEHAKLDDDRINIEAERLSFGLDGTADGRGALARLYGGDLFQQRLKVIFA